MCRINLKPAMQYPDERIYMQLFACVFFAFLAFSSQDVYVSGNLPTIPWIQFGQDFYDLKEGMSATNITVERNGRYSGEVNVSYSVSYSVSGDSRDWNNPLGSIIFEDNQHTIWIEVLATDDQIEEHDENITVHLLSATGGGRIGTPASTTIRIIDNDRRVGIFQFVANSAQATEQLTALFEVWVERVNGSFGNISVPVSVKQLTAEQFSDFEVSITSLLFKHRETRKSISVLIKLDRVEEFTETFMLGLGIPSHKEATLGKPEECIISIVDYDRRPGFIQLSQKNIAVNETDKFVEIEIRRIWGSFGAVAVYYSTWSQITATPDIDYESTTNVVTIAHQQTSHLVKVNITDDKKEEFDEEFEMEIDIEASQFGARLGSVTSTKVLIVDDDRKPGTLRFTTNHLNVSEASGSVRNGGLRVAVERINGSFGIVNFGIKATGSASPVTDYQPLSVEYRMAHQQSTTSLTVILRDDDVGEHDKTLYLRIENVTSQFGTVIHPEDRSIRVDLLDDDRVPGILQFNHIYFVVSEDIGIFNITVNRVNGSYGPMRSFYTVSDQSQIVPPSFSLKFEDNQRSGMIALEIKDDKIEEHDKNITVRLVGTSVGSVGSPAEATITILDNDRQPGVLIFDSPSDPILEGTGNKTVSISVRRVNGTFGNLKVPYTVGNRSIDTSSAGEDYIWPDATIGYFLIGHGADSGRISIIIIDDEREEYDETLTVKILTPTYQYGQVPESIPDPLTLTIVDDDRKPGIIQLSTSRLEVAESSELRIELKRDGGSFGSADVFSVTQNSGSATEGADYSPISTKIHFTNGQTSAMVTVYLNNDTDQEFDENFQIYLEKITSEFHGAVLGNIRTTDVYIIDDDRVPGTLRFARPSQLVSEEEGSLQVLVERIGGSFGNVSFEIAAEGSAAPVIDYNFTWFLRMRMQLSHQQTNMNLTVVFKDDDIREPDKELTLKLTNIDSQFGAALHPTQSNTTLQLLDDDRVEGTIQFSPALYRVPEHIGYVNISLERFNGSYGKILASFLIEGDETDYENPPKMVLFGDNETTAMTQLRITDDQREEPNENVTIRLKRRTAGPIGSASTAVVTIIDDDRLASVVEIGIDTSTASTSNATVLIPVHRSVSLIGKAFVSYQILNGSSGIPKVLHPASGVVQFDDGQHLKYIELRIAQDKVLKLEEVFIVQLQIPTGDYMCILGNQTQCQITIIDKRDRGKLQLVQAAYKVKEDIGEVKLDVQRIAGLVGSVMVSYKTVDGSAISGKDYKTATGNITFLQNEKQKAISVEVNDNKKDELDRYFEVHLFNPTGGAQLGRIHVSRVTIQDDDPLTFINSIIIGCKIHFLNKIFKLAFKDHYSKEYKTLGNEIEQILKSELVNVPSIDQIVFVGAWEGSVVADVRAVVDKRIDNGSFILTLRSAVKSGKLGNFAVDPNYDPVQSIFKGNNVSGLQVNCQGGQYLDLTTFTCKPCRRNYYQPSSATNVCFRCANGYFTSNEGAANKDDCRATKEDYVLPVVGAVIGFIGLLVLITITITCCRSQRRNNNGSLSSANSGIYPYPRGSGWHWPRYRDNYLWFSYDYENSKHGYAYGKTGPLNNSHA